MKKLFYNKYFYLIFAIILAVFNAVLFLLVKDAGVFNLPAFWVTYGFVMLGFLFMVLISIINRKAKLHQDVASVFMLPLSFIMILLGIVFFFFVKSVYLVTLLIPFIIISGIILIGLVLSLMYKESLNHVEEKEVIASSLSELNGIIKTLYAKTNNSVMIKLIDQLVSLTNDINDEVDGDERIIEYCYFVKKDLESNNDNNAINNAKKMIELLGKRK